MATQQATQINPVLIEGQQVSIRPIRHNDKALEDDFVENLSSEAKQNRFSGGVRQLSASDIKQLCDVDYHDSMAFVATIHSDGDDREVGVARYIKSPVLGSHELAVTIADDFRNTVLGRILVEYLVAYGRQHGVKTLYSIDLNNNTDMRKLAEDLDMSVRLDPDDAHKVIYSMNVDEHPETITF